MNTYQEGSLSIHLASHKQGWIASCPELGIVDDPRPDPMLALNVILEAIHSYLTYVAAENMPEANLNKGNGRGAHFIHLRYWLPKKGVEDYRFELILEPLTNKSIICKLSAPAGMDGGASPG